MGETRRITTERGRVTRRIDDDRTAGRGRNCETGPATGDGTGGADPWRIGAPTSTVKDHAPPVDVYRGLAVGDDRTVRVSFEKPYAERPKLGFGRRGGGVRGVSYATDANGNFDGATVTVAESGGVVDLFVDPP